MAVVKSWAIHGDPDFRGRNRYSVILTDNDGIDTDPIITLPTALDGDTVANNLLQARKDAEVLLGDIVPKWQDTQADYDRISLGQAMTFTDVDEFYSHLPLFKAMESRGGANANQRATYLGVSRANYDLMADRFNDVEGIAFFLDNAKGQIWDVIPEEFK